MRPKRSVFIIDGASLLAAICFLILAPVSYAQSAGASRVDVREVTDEADAVLAILSKKRAQQSVTEADWQRLFASEGYVRLKKREAEMKRDFTDADFKAFVLSDQLSTRAPLLAATLEKWKRAELDAAARRALAYLPGDARIRAKIYPVIKPRENSFVFELDTDPAIFLYLDPAVSREKFENTLAHELHHIGYGSSCPSKQTTGEVSKLSQNAQAALEWLRAFGEGFAVLAAAGGPDVHPHAVSEPEERARWDHDIANFNNDLKRVEKFFQDVLASKLSEEERQKAAFSFYGEQGPWYTVGWKMATIIEKTYGRAKLIELMCDQRKLLATYNEAAAQYNRTAREPLALWSVALVDGIRK
ncbi:MAG: DUF5700 domain-containing putative Zn-dependent protease [Pyrinomonadaceae bacterium]